MKKAKKIIACLMALVMITAMLAGCGSPSDTAKTTTTIEAVTYKLNLPTAESDSDAFYVLAKSFADKVAELSDGKITIEIHANAALGSGSDAVLGIQNGTIDFNVDSTNTLSSEYSKLSICDLPYMFDNVDQVLAFCDTEYMDEMVSEAADQLGVRILAFGDGGFRAIWSNKGEIHSYEDFQGLKIRVPDVSIYVDTFNAIGANATPMAGSEVFTALQQQTVDAAEFPIATGISLGHMESCNYVIDDQHFYNLICIQVSEAVWEQMSPEVQAIIAQAAEDAQAEQVAVMADVAGGLVDTLAENGLDYVPPENVDLSEVREAVQPVYAQYRDVIGADFYDQCMAWFDANR